MKNVVKVAGVGLVGLLAACGGLNNAGTGAPATSDNLTQADAQSLSEAAVGDLSLTGAMLGDASSSSLAMQSAGVNSLEANAQSWGLPGRVVLILRALGHYIPAAGSGSCTISKTGDLTDADGDGVPVDGTTSFDCTATGPAGATYTTKGSVELKDTNDAQANSGYSVIFSGFKTRVSADANRAKERTLEGSYSIDKQTSTYSIAKNYTQTVQITNFNNVYNGSLTFAVSKTYTPDDIAKPWAAGTIEVKKDAPGSATWVRGNNTRTLNWYTDPTLHWNRAACANPGRALNFDSGAKQYVYTNPAGAQSVLRIEFTACGTYTVTFNGSAVPAN